jgi:hypothetical protein
MATIEYGRMIKYMQEVNLSTPRTLSLNPPVRRSIAATPGSGGLNVVHKRNSYADCGNAAVGVIPSSASSLNCFRR